MVIVEPGQYLLAVSKDDLKILRQALKDWEGPYPDGNGSRTPIQIEYQEKDTARAGEMALEIGKILRR
jgi:hypothetical protein